MRNELVPDGRGSVRAVPTEEREVIPCGLVFRSVGYRGVELCGRAVRRRAARRSATTAAGSSTRRRPVPGVYCAGWIKRGPSGVIGTNKKDATETVELLLEDARAGALPRAPDASAEAVDALLAERGAEVVMYAGWELIDGPSASAAPRTAGRGSSSRAGTSCSGPPGG